MMVFVARSETVPAYVIDGFNALQYMDRKRQQRWARVADRFVRQIEELRRMTHIRSWFPRLGYCGSQPADVASAPAKKK
jgi:hypothetical protein